MANSNPFDPKAPMWRLEGPLNPDRASVFYNLDRFPVTVGRRATSDLKLGDPSVSGQHARFSRNDGVLILEDLGSTNGTLVNGDPLRGRRALVEGDVVQFGAIEFRVLESATTEVFLDDCVTRMVEQDHGNEGTIGLRRVRELIDGVLIRNVFQSIVRIEDGGRIGYESLSRGCHPKLEESPERLLNLAGRGGMAAELSALFRDRAIASLERSDLPPLKLFVNAHASELENEQLVSSILDGRLPHARHELVLEVHEGAILQADSFRALRDSLVAIGVEIAYDDFGEGQTRIAEIGSCPPHYIKFARPLIAGIEQAGWERRHVLQTMVSMARDLGSIPLAEGVETAEELEVCAELGFVLAQGYYFDQPSSIEALGRPTGSESEDPTETSSFAGVDDLSLN